jgi:hypothetical protein
MVSGADDSQVVLLDWQSGHVLQKWLANTSPVNRLSYNLASDSIWAGTWFFASPVNRLSYNLASDSIWAGMWFFASPGFRARADLGRC